MQAVHGWLSTYERLVNSQNFFSPYLTQEDISRFGREFVSTSEYVERILPNMGVRLICINDGYDSIREEADTDLLMLPLKMVMNDSYVRDISRKIRSGISAKMNSGEFLPAAGSIPYGYLRNVKENTYDIDSEAADVVKRIFTMRADGRAFNEIARTLNAGGVPSPGRLRYERGLTKSEKYRDALWLPKTIRKIATDRVYLGYRIHGKIKRDKIGRNKTQRPEESWQIIENAHPALVHKELFDQVQKVNLRELEKRRHYGQRNSAEEDYRDLFRGLVYCADCHSLMSAGKGCARAGVHTPSRIFYDCSTYRYSGHIHCTSHYVRQEQIYAVVRNAIDQQVKVAVDVEQLVESIRNSPKAKRAFAEASETSESITMKRKGIENRIEGLLIALTERIIDRNEYEYMKAKYSQQLKTLLKAEEAAAARRNVVQEQLAVTQEWLRVIKEYQALPTLTPEILKQLIKEVRVHSNQSITIAFNFSDPYRSIAELQNCVEGVGQVG